MSYFHNKRIWVTGASSGIGRSVAIKLSKLGAEVILTARNRDKLEEVKKECGNAKAHIFDHDLSKLESIDDLVNKVTREVGWYSSYLQIISLIIMVNLRNGRFYFVYANLGNQ